MLASTKAGTTVYRDLILCDNRVSVNYREITITGHLIALFRVNEGKHTMSFIVGDDAGKSNYNLKDNVTIKRNQQ